MMLLKSQLVPCNSYDTMSTVAPLSPAQALGDETRVAVEVTQHALRHGGVVAGVDAGGACREPEVAHRFC
jgi:hypothetical protein